MGDMGEDSTTKGSVREGLIIPGKRHIMEENQMIPAAVKEDPIILGKKHIMEGLRENRMTQAVKEDLILGQKEGMATSIGEGLDKSE